MAENMQELCEDSCAGTATNLTMIKNNMLADETVTDISDVFKALGDPTRIKMIHALLKGELCVHDLTVVLDMGQSAVSHQLRYLRNLRIVKRRKVGKTVFYSLDDHHIEEIFLQTLRHLTHE